jgi:acetolactate synthase-1/3 small subunit
MFSARGYNIDSLSVAPTLDPTVSRITCTTSGSDEVVEQIVKQLRKLIDVLRVVQFPIGSGDFVAREMILIKLQAPGQDKKEIMRIADIFRAKVVDVTKDNLTLEVTGDQGKLTAFLDLLNPSDILEVARTGTVALSRRGDRLQIGTTPVHKNGERGEKAMYGV